MYKISLIFFVETHFVKNGRINWEGYSQETRRFCQMHGKFLVCHRDSGRTTHHRLRESTILGITKI